MGMQLLYRAGMGSQPHRFPSWIPDWTIPKPNGLYEARDRGVVFNAGGGTKEQMTCRDCDSGSDAFNELNIAGYIVDRIEHLTRPCNEPKAWRQYFSEIDNMVDTLRLRYSVADRERLKREVPIAGAQHPQFAASESLDIPESYKAFRRILHKQNYTKKYQQDRNSPVCSSPISSPSSSSSFSSSTVASRLSQEMSLAAKSKSNGSLLGDNLKGWKFVTTEERRCGLVPNSVQQGDEVVMFCGGEVPFTLRECLERKGTYRLIGECYVSGIMQGEALDESDVVMKTLRIH
ncbi:hypothetical protein QQZ08_007979 [Neonectria magnoliae]|uniref:Uncharacterized protein n=1 Tax=Neonectria magnoliae TaxID=2732573 RepID=A0ABR1HY33_9HYPO